MPAGEPYFGRPPDVFCSTWTSKSPPSEGDKESNDSFIPQTWSQPHSARPSPADTEMHKNGPRPSSQRPAPLRQTQPLAPSSCAPHSPRQPSRDSSSLWEGTCGTNKERGWAKVKARRDLGGARGGLGGCGAAGKERGARRRGWVRREDQGPRGGD